MEDLKRRIEELNSEIAALKGEKVQKLVVTSTGTDFTWDCNANVSTIVSHTIKTYTSALATLEESPSAVAVLQSEMAKLVCTK